jgi:hypothetical protein
VRGYQARAARPAGVSTVKSDRDDVSELARQVAANARASNPFAHGTEVEFELNDTPAPIVGPPEVTVLHRLGRVPVGWMLIDYVCLEALEPICRMRWDASSITLASMRSCRGKVLVW